MLFSMYTTTSAERARLAIPQPPVPNPRLPTMMSHPSSSTGSAALPSTCTTCSFPPQPPTGSHSSMKAPTGALSTTNSVAGSPPTFQIYYVQSATSPPPRHLLLQPRSKGFFSMPLHNPRPAKGARLCPLGHPSHHPPPIPS